MCAVQARRVIVLQANEESDRQGTYANLAGGRGSNSQTKIALLEKSFAAALFACVLDHQDMPCSAKAQESLPSSREIRCLW